MSNIFWAAGFTSYALSFVLLDLRDSCPLYFLLLCIFFPDVLEKAETIHYLTGKPCVHGTHLPNAPVVKTGFEWNRLY